MSTLKLSNGDSVELAEFCSRGDHKKMQKMLFAGRDINASNATNVDISFDSVQSAEEFIVVQLIKSITTKDGSEIEPSVDYLDSISLEDYNIIKEAVNELTNPKTTA